MFDFLGALLGSVLVAQAQPSLSVNMTVDSALEVSWPITETDYSLEMTDTLAPSRWAPIAIGPVVRNSHFVLSLRAADTTEFFRLRQNDTALIGIEGTSPFDGESGVAVTRESIVRFSGALGISAVFNADTFYAIAAGRKILSRAEISSDHQRATLFYLEPLPGGAQVDVFLDPGDIVDTHGHRLNPASFPPDHNILSFSTLSLTPLAQTAVIGTVYAAELGGGSSVTGTNKPLASVTVTVDGMEQTLRAVTDSMGNFKLSPVPPGKFFVHIDGRTVENQALGIHYPDKAYYPFVGKAWEAVAGRANSLAGGTGKIYLPLIVAGTLQAVSEIVPTTISFPPAVVANNPALAAVSVTVAANSLFADDGTRGGRVGIAPVRPDRLPGPLPAGLEVPLVITVQTDGPLNFDTPAPVCFPNLPDPVLGVPLPAGSKQELISFNHKKGIWEAVGSMTVTADGALICSDPGVGILQPGWHTVAPKPEDPPPPPCDDSAPKSAVALVSASERSFVQGVTPLERPGVLQSPLDKCFIACATQAEICRKNAQESS